MGWYCSEILAQHSPRLVEILLEIPGVNQSLYYVDSLPGPRPNLPKNGLVFVRDVGHAIWDDRTAVPWPEPPPLVDVALAIPPDLPKIRTMEGEEVSLGLPERFLKFLQWLSRDTGSVVAYYTAFSWGGPFEREFAWIFEPRERVYCRLYGEPHIRVYREGAKPTEEEVNVLIMTLWRLGVDAPEWDFPPHCGHFDWSNYKIPPRDEAGDE